MKRIKYSEVSETLVRRVVDAFNNEIDNPNRGPLGTAWKKAIAEAINGFNEEKGNV